MMSEIFNPAQQLMDEAVRQAVAGALSTQMGTTAQNASSAPAVPLTRKVVDAETGAVSTQHALYWGLDNWGEALWQEAAE